MRRIFVEVCRASKKQYEEKIRSIPKNAKDANKTDVVAPNLRFKSKSDQQSDTKKDR
jgi:hypothetical protein